MSAEATLRDALAWAVTASPNVAALMDEAPALDFDPAAQRLQARRGTHGWAVWQHRGELAVEFTEQPDGFLKVTLLLPRDLRIPEGA